MNFNRDKYVAMHFRADNKCNDCFKKWQALAKSTKGLDIGIIIASELKASKQVKRAESRATMVACRIRNTFKHR